MIFFFSSNDLEIAHFEPTPLMSVYLLAFFVGDYATKNHSSKIAIYTHQDSLGQIEFISAEALKHLKIMEDYTSILYQLPKLDFVGIPTEGHGGMENWGMTTIE